MNDETIMACLTPPGKAAIATLAVRGPRAWQIVRPLFQPMSFAKTTAGPSSLPEGLSSDRCWVGRFGDSAKGGSDEVVLNVRRGDPCPWLELHCHGGQETIALLIELLAAHGALACSWQELERRTNADVLRCLAQEHLAQAPTARSAQILLDQYHGAFEKSLKALMASMEARATQTAIEQLRELAGRSGVGRHLVQPWKVVVAGPPNVGKSSLANALTGYNRCLVSPQPGTTRDIVTVTLAIDGWPVELLDTAGWRDTDQALEKEGIERARQAAAEADLCLWLMDGSTAFALPEPVRPNQCDVINKVDLTPAWNWAALPGAVRVSAQTGAGLAELCQVISHKLASDPPPPGAAVPFTAELGDRIEKALELTTQGLEQKALDLVRDSMMGLQASSSPICSVR